MRHLGGTQIMDAADGRLDAAAAAHAAACAECGARVTEMREALRGLAAVDVPQPSPLFWDHFPARVLRAIEIPAAPRRRFTPARLMWGSVAALVVVVVLLLLPRAMSPTNQGPLTNAVLNRAEPSPVLNRVEPWPFSDPSVDDLEADDAWALVRSVAEDLDYDGARQLGVAPRAGSIERAAMELSASERAELARLIEQELKRTGA